MRSQNPTLKSFKSALQFGYSTTLLLKTIANQYRPDNDKEPRVFYGGARGGNLGGPLVKINRLKKIFPEHNWDFNLVYCLSNAPYLPDTALKILSKRGIPIVHNQNGLYYKAWYNGDYQKQNQRMARTYHQASFVFWQSEFCKKSSEIYLGTRSGPGEILYNAVDTKHFSPTEKISSNATTLLITGKFDDNMYYRIDNTIRGLAKAVNNGFDGFLNIAGWVGQLVKSKSEQLAIDLGISKRIKFLGPYDQEAAPRIYSAADIYIMTKHNDPCPNTVLEAMSCGLPVVHSISGGVPELVGDTGVGIVVPEDFERIHVPSPGDLGSAIMQAAADRAELSVLARKRAIEKFDIANWINRHREVFSQVIEDANLRNI